MPCASVGCQACTRYDDVIREHVRRILWQVEVNPKRSAIGEAAQEDGNDPSNWYPENAFHTYWTFNLLTRSRIGFVTISRIFARSLVGRASTLIDCVLKRSLGLGRRRVIKVRYTPRVLQRWIQINWRGLSPELQNSEKIFRPICQKQDFLRYALKCLFEQQNASGIWRRGSALFHYPIRKCILLLFERLRFYCRAR